MAAPIASSKRRAWAAVVLGLLGVVAIPAAIYIADRSKAVALLDAAYAVPFGFFLGLIATIMGHRAKRNLEWLRIDGGGGTGVARTARTLGILAVSLALTGALSVGFYEAVLYYQRHHG